MVYDSNWFYPCFVSNTTAVMIMIPIGLAIIKEAHELKVVKQYKSLNKFEQSLVLAIGYTGTISGLGTLIGTTINHFKGSGINLHLVKKLVLLNG